MKKKFLIVIPLFLVLGLLLSSCLLSKQESLLYNKYLYEKSPVILTFSKPIKYVEFLDEKYELSEATTIFIAPKIVKKSGNYTIKYKDEKGNIYEENITVFAPKFHLFVYAGADNSEPYVLDDFYILDLSEIRNGIKNKIGIFVTLVGDRKNNGKILDEIRFIYSDGREVVFHPAELKDQNTDFSDLPSEFPSSDSNFLNTVLNKFMSTSNSTIKFLVMWDHGNMWIGEGRPFYYLKSVNSGYKGIIEDEGEVMKLSDLKKAILDWELTKGSKINILGFDACNMLTFEIIYEFSNLNLDYIVGSILSEPGTGWDYNFISDFNAEDPYNSLFSSLIDLYRFSSSQQELTMSVVNIEKFKEIKENIFYVDNIDARNYQDGIYEINVNGYNLKYLDISFLKSNEKNLIEDIDSLVPYRYIRLTYNFSDELTGIGIIFSDIRYSQLLWQDYQSLDFYKNDGVGWIDYTWFPQIVSYYSY